MADEGMTARGLAGAEAIVKELEFVTSSGFGAGWFVDESREPYPGHKSAPTHSELLGYLAAGGRDITPNEKDQRGAAVIIRDAVAKSLQKTGRTTPDGKPVAQKPIEQRAKAGMASGLRKAAKDLVAIMTTRVERGVDNKGRKKEVTEEWARRRARMFNSSDSTSLVLVASTQLANALIKGNVKVFAKGGDPKAVLRQLGIR